MTEKCSRVLADSYLIQAIFSAEFSSSEYGSEPIYMVCNQIFGIWPNIWYMAEYMVYGHIFGKKSYHIYGYGRTTKKSGTVDLCLIGSVATTMKGGRGRRSTLYVIGDYLYYSGHLQGYILRVRCRYFKSRPIPCRGSAHLDTETLQIVKLSGEHSCVKDPDLKYKIQMETEMKELAETTDFTFKDIFNEVCLKNPEIAQRISFSRVSTSMRLRRDAARARRN